MDEFITGVDEYMASGLLSYYYLLVFIVGLFLSFKHRKLNLSLLLVLIFWEGLFVFLGAQYYSIFRPIYRIGIVTLSIILCYKGIFTIKSSKQHYVNTLFLLITVVFWISFLINNQQPFTSLSQFGKNYLLPFLFFHEFLRLSPYPKYFKAYSNLFRDIIIAQVIFSIVKILLLGFGESIVGSMSFTGGGLATTLPVLGLIYIWVRANGLVTKKDWLLVIGLVVIAIASNKRAPIFILPIIVLLLNTYVYKTRTFVSLIKYIPLFFLLLYVGVRSNPSLNPEASRWGSFNLEYALLYSNDYMFGSERRLEIDEAKIYGRGGAFLAFFSSDFYNVPIKTLFFGDGIEEILDSYEDFDTVKYGVAHKGALNGALAKFISLGLLGLVFHFLYGASLINFIGFKKLQHLIIGIFAWDFFLYDGVMLEHSAMAVLFVFIIIANTNFNQNDLQ